MTVYYDDSAPPRPRFRAERFEFRDGDVEVSIGLLAEVRPDGRLSAPRDELHSLFSNAIAWLESRIPEVPESN
jgi:hypothetical protein